MNDKDLKELCNKLCEKAPNSMTQLIAELEGIRGLQDPLIFNFINACRESEFLGDECGE